MATISKVAMLVAGAHFVALASIASPSTALAQENFPQQKPATSDAPLTARMPDATEAAGPTVWVHLTGSETAELQQDTVGDHKHWITVCTAPCDKAVSTAFSYRVGGEGIRNSRVFSLHPANGSRETVDVDEGSKAGFVLGIVGVSVGSAALFVGLIVVLVSSITESFDGGESPDRSGQQAGLAILGVGLVGVIGGAVAIATNARTKVTEGPASQGASLPAGAWAFAPGASGALKSAFQDAYPDKSRRDIALDRALPPMVGIPLFGGSF
jgi:hypothetical protein